MRKEHTTLTTISLYNSCSFFFVLYMLIFLKLTLTLKIQELDNKKDICYCYRVPKKH